MDDMYGTTSHNRIAWVWWGIEAKIAVEVMLLKRWVSVEAFYSRYQ